MDSKKSGSLVNKDLYPGVTFGHGVVIYGRVKIGQGTYIGDYTILGIPSADHIQDATPMSQTTIKSNAYIGPFCVINNGAKIDSGVRIEEYCKVGWESKIGAGTMLMYGAQTHWNVKIGKNCIIEGFCCDCSIIEDNVVMFGNLIHKFEDPLDRKFRDPRLSWHKKGGKEPSPRIGKLSIIGFDSLIIGGVKVFPRSYVFAGAIVTKDVRPPKNIVKGKRHLTAKEWKDERDKNRDK